MEEEEEQSKVIPAESSFLDITQDVVSRALMRPNVVDMNDIEIVRAENDEAGTSTLMEFEISDLIESDHLHSTEMEVLDTNNDLGAEQRIESATTSTQIQVGEAINVEQEENTEKPTTSTDMQAEVVIVCPSCKYSSELRQFSKSSYRPQNRAQVVWIYRSQCANKQCGLWFGSYRRFDRGVFIEVTEDGRPLGEEVSNSKIPENERLVEEKEDIQKVHYTVDGFEYSGPIPANVLAACSEKKCDVCGENSEVRPFKKSVFRSKTKPWIFKTKCTSDFCGVWFGKGIRLDRSSITRVDDDGRPFGRSQISRMKPTEQEIMEVEEISQDKPEQEEIEELEDDDSEEDDEKIDKQANTSKDKTKSKRRKKKRTTYQTGKQSTLKKRKLQMQMDIEAGIIAKPEKVERPKSSRGYVYVVEPVEGVAKEDEVVTGPRKSRNQSHAEATPEIEVQEAPSTSKAKTPLEKRLAKKEKDRIRYQQLRDRKAAKKTEAVKSTTPKKRESSANRPLPRTEISNSSTSPSSSSGSSHVGYANTGTQMGNELLVETEYYKKLYIDDLNANFKPQIVVRLNSLPPMVRATMLNMNRIIKEQESQIKEYRRNQVQFQEMMPKVTEHIKKIRLTCTDSIRRIGEDIIEFNDEYGKHNAVILSLFRQHVKKFEEAKAEVDKRYEDMVLKCQVSENKMKVQEAVSQYERDRADYFVFLKDRFEQQRNEARKLYKDIETKLSDTVYIKNEQKCTHCQIFEKLVKNMKKEVVEYQLQRDQAFKEKKDGEARTQNAERCAQILSTNVDKLRYENRTWVDQIEKLKDQIEKLKEQNEALKKMKQNGAPPNGEKRLTPPSNTPMSASNTPLHIEPSSSTPSASFNKTIDPRKERISPLEDGEIDEDSRTPPLPQAKNKKPVEPILEKKSVKPPPIDAGFASWIPKDQLNAPPPLIPTAESPFGVPKAALQIEKNVVEQPKLPPSQAPLPWEPKSKLTDGMSDTLKMVAAKVDAERFFGTMPPPKERKKPPQPEMIANNKKPVPNQNPNQNANQNQKKMQHPKPVQPWTAPPLKKIKNDVVAPAANNSPRQNNYQNSPGRPSSSNQPPNKPEETSSPFGVPNTPSVAEKPPGGNKSTQPTKIASPQRPQKKKNFAQNRAGGIAPWAGSPAPSGQQQQHFRMPLQRERDSFFGASPGTSDRSFSTGGLPWHRNDNSNTTHVDTPFGKVPVRDEAWGRSSSSSWTNDTNWTNDNAPPSRNFSFFGAPQQPPQNQQHGQPQSFMKRSFWD